MLNYNVKIGLVAMRRNTTNRPRGTFLTWYSAEERGKKFVQYIEENFATEKVSFVDNKGIGIQDLVFDDATAAEVVERFQAEKVDAVMIINCNFGNEEAAADIAKALGKPVLLWAPLDDEYYVDGMRPTDSQCGLFGVSRQFQRYHIPFSHLPSCRVESEEFREGFESFVRVACMVKNFKDMKILQVGTRVKPFKSIMYNELELAERFGIDIVAFNLAEALNDLKEIHETKQEQLEKDLAQLKATFDCGKLDDEYLKKMLYEYCMLENCRAENEYQAMMNNLRSRKPDELDGLEFILALNRYRVTANILNDIHNIIIVFGNDSSEGKK